VLDAEYCHSVGVLSLYVTCVLVTTAGSTKTDEPIDMPFAGEDKRARSKRNCVLDLDGGPDPEREEASFVDIRDMYATQTLLR